MPPEGDRKPARSHAGAAGGGGGEEGARGALRRQGYPAVFCRRRPQGSRRRRRLPRRLRGLPRRQDHPRRPPQGQEPVAAARFPALPFLPVRFVNLPPLHFCMVHLLKVAIFFFYL